MHVLILSTNYLPQLGGVEMVVHHLARYLLGQGHSVTLVTSRAGARYGSGEDEGIRVHRTYLGIPGSGLRSTLAFPILAPVTWRRLYKLVQHLHPDLVNLQFADNATAYALALVQHFDLPLIVSLHGADVQRLAQEKPIYGRLQQRALRRSAAVTACSADLLASAHVAEAAPEKPTYVIPNGVDVDRFAGAGGYDYAYPYLLMIARLVDEKGVDIAIQGFAQLAEEFGQLHLLIAGDGPRYGKLSALVSDLGLIDRVKFLGQMSPMQIPSLIAGCELFLLSSRKESFGIVLLEAMAGAKAVVATKVGGIPEFVADGQHGLLIPPEDSVALKDAVTTLLEQPTLRQEMGHRGQAAVRASYSWEHMGRRYLHVFQEALHSSDSGEDQGECTHEIESGGSSAQT